MQSIETDQNGHPTPDPNLLRACASALEGVEHALPAETGAHIVVARGFLRAAADQLEAVQCLTTYREPSDACYNCHGAGYLDGGDMRDDEPCYACGGRGTQDGRND